MQMCRLDAAGCEVVLSSIETKRCIYGDDASDKTVLLVGDSKASQWEPAMQVIAEQSRWQLQVMTKSGCAISEADRVLFGERYATCRVWNKAAMSVIAEEGPDLVVVASFAREGIEQSEPDDAVVKRETMVNGYAESWRQIESLGIPVVVILDNPNPVVSIYECAAANLEDLSVCSFELAPALAESGAQTQQAAADLAGIDAIDLTEFICPDECPAVIGNVLLYRHSSHLTRTFVESLVPEIASRLSDITDGALGGL